MYSVSFTARPTGTSNSTPQDWTGRPSSPWPQPVASQGLSCGFVAAPPCRPSSSFFPPPTSLGTRGFSSRFFPPPEAMASAPRLLPLFTAPCSCEAPNWSPVPGSRSPPSSRGGRGKAKSRIRPSCCVDFGLTPWRLPLAHPACSRTLLAMLFTPRPTARRASAQAVSSGTFHHRGSGRDRSPTRPSGVRSRSLPETPATTTSAK